MMRPRPCSRIVVPQPVEMGELGADAAEIVPDAAQDRLDLGGDFSGNAAARLARPMRCSGSHGPTVRISAPPTFGHASRIDQPDRAQRMRPRGSRARHRRCAAAAIRVFDAAREPCRCGLERDDDLAEHLPAFQPREAALEIGERRFRCRSPAASPFAILARLSRMLRIEAPNEPKILYCCWNSCIRLKVMVGPAVEPQVTSRPPRLSTAASR